MGLTLLRFWLATSSASFTELYGPTPEGNVNVAEGTEGERKPVRISVQKCFRPPAISNMFDIAVWSDRSKVGESKYIRLQNGCGCHPEIAEFSRICPDAIGTFKIIHGLKRYRNVPAASVTVVFRASFVALSASLRAIYPNLPTI